MKTIKLIAIVLFLWIYTFGIIVSQQTYFTQPLSDNIKTLQLLSTNNFNLLPIIELNSKDRIVVKFDNLEISQPRLRYKIQHCNSDWSISDINEIDYLNGFNDNVIQNYNYSNNTHVNYINYSLELPNRDIDFKVSGNYLLTVFDEYAPNNYLLTACFSVVESKVSIDAVVSGNTDVDFNREHQQVSFTINHKGLALQYPQEEIKVSVKQNTRSDNIAEDIKPTYVYPDKLVYEHNKKIIFESGNEFRRFEIVNKQYGGLNVNSVEYIAPYYNAWLDTDDVRANKVRYYDKDQNGTFMIRSDGSYDSNVSGDYFLVHFALDANTLIPNNIKNNIWIDGEFAYNGYYSPLEYDALDNVFHTSILLKQGSYNYQYLSESLGVKSTASIEGNYFDTDNTYTILVYHRSPGERYDKLIGFLQVN